MSVSGAATPPSSVQVQRLTNVIHTAISGKFRGFGQNRIFNLANDSWWKQTSIESTESSLPSPEVFLWSKNGGDYLGIPQDGETVSAEMLNVLFESTITNTFTGLSYGNEYQLLNGETWLQIGFETAATNVSQPTMMLWVKDGETNMLVRGKQDVTIGTCTVADPEADMDGDMMSNAAEIIAGSDIQDPHSVFKVSETTRDGIGQTVLYWESVTGRVYSISWTPSLIEPFQPLETNILWPQESWTDTVHGVQTKSFYRIDVRLAD